MPDLHWHAFAWNGSAVPPDGQARDSDVAVMPRELADWFRKPEQLHKGAFATAEAAHEWLAKELAGVVTASGRTPDTGLAHALIRLRLGQDGYVGLYASGGFLVRALLTCPRTGGDARPVPCPGRGGVA
ncbi:hypothetical protein [Streptomyces boncukensis]|uniref:Uncharacterized protein n=1 Tax=Streptomyces boncukensis TaxID=2711219 RepID=A0A6G4WUQ6_9ACTN|nr:hypothetical protein [Streptomyces boncukensis]NGO68274.1 hypothetical protein [Streptomyces boncukensis]